MTMIVADAPTLRAALPQIIAQAEARPRRRTRDGYNIHSDTDPRHGTKAGYDAHRAAGQKACERCLRGSARVTKFFEVLSAQGISRRHHPCTVKRRLQALVAFGYSYSHLDRELGTERHVWAWINRDAAYYPQDTYDRVAALYQRLHMTPPVATNKREALEIRRAQERGVRNGWALPLAWDDDTIDNPDARPFVPASWGYLSNGRSNKGHPVDRLQGRSALLRDCNERRMTAAAAARELGMSSKQTLQKWTQHNDGFCRVLSRIYNELARRDTIIVPDQRTGIAV